MTVTDEQPNRRILVIDDHEPIHEDFRKILCSPKDTTASDSVTTTIPDQTSSTDLQIKYEIDSALQGEQGLAQVKQAQQDDRPYAVVIVNLHMPTGWDGIETIKHLWQHDPKLQVVICTACCDHSWEQTIERLGPSGRLLILKKPFDDVEVGQIVHALTEKWNLARSVELHATSLQKANDWVQYEVDQRRKGEDLLRHNVFHDSLTDLPNRTSLLARMERCIEHVKCDGNHRFAVLYLDLDNFKVINDSLGHRIGDELLITAARRLDSCLRRLDRADKPFDDATARLGGDEFVILLGQIAQLEDAEIVAQRVTKVLSMPFQIGGQEVSASLSMGIAVSDSSYDDPTDILRDADTALYQAKARGKNRYEFFNTEMRDAAITRLRLEQDLRKGIELGQLLLYYQPIVNLETGAIESFEALVRWQHPEHGLMAPIQFIPIAEETGLIIPMGRWVIEEACHQVQRWHEQFSQHRNLSVSVNLSVKQFRGRDFLAEIDEILKNTGVDTRHINLEITESVMAEDCEENATLFKAFRARGLDVHVDDFGTGYSSLSCLHKLPISAIKIDRLFVRNMNLDGKHAATVQAVVELAANRKMKVIAEGIETVEHLLQLQALNCDLGQGYYFSRPVPADTTEALLNSGVNRIKAA